MQKYDYLIKNAKVFDGSEQIKQQDIAVLAGKIVAREANIAENSAKEIIDASGKWLMPGLFDIHTHYDLELEFAPGLQESVRHGTTSVVIANCSLGLAFGNQRSGEADPIVDCYARVENIPKSVLRQTADKVTWNTPAEYLAHLQTLNLGPNVVPLYPHSMLRIEVMGFDDSISRDASDNELQSMCSLLAEGLDMGYSGFSTDALPYHYLANQPNTHKTIPTQFAPYSEIKALTQVVRERQGVWQATPPKDSVINTIKTFLLCSGRLHKIPLKTTVVAALDIANNRKIIKMGKVLSRFLNSKFVAGQLYLQALGAPFKVWANGPITPLAEEIPELRALNATDLDERDKRMAILNDPEFIQAFRKMWLAGKQGLTIARLKRWLRLEDYALNRSLADMKIDICPMESWQGLNFQEVFELVKAGKSEQPQDLTEAELDLIEKEFFWVADEADFMLQMLRTFDLDLSWHTVSANRDPKKLREIVMDPLLIPGFNDSGAHLTNMAFYDANLRSLQMAAQGGEADVAYMVKRLTRDAADLFNVEGGRIEIGDQADIILVDPEQLNQYQAEENIERVYRQEFQHHQLVNRSDGVVPLVMINGKILWRDKQFSQYLHKQPAGRLLLSKYAKSAVTAGKKTAAENFPQQEPSSA